MTVAVDADSGQDGARFRHVSAADLGRFGERRLRIRHQRQRDGPLAVAQAIPAGHARARSQRGWLDDVAQHPKFVLRRADAQANILAVARVLAGYANWDTMLTRPTWDVLMARTGLSRSTTAVHLAWLRSAGLLGLVAGGTTPQFSPGVLRANDAQERNEAAVYVLCAPTNLRLVALPHPDDAGAEFVDDGRDDAPCPPTTECAGDTTRTLSPSRSEEETPARARETRHHQDPALHRPDPAWPVSQRPASKPQRHLAALEARRRIPLLRALSTAYVAALFREPHLAGWTLADILHALDTQPDGTPWPHTTPVRHIPGFVRHRLNAWRNTTGDDSGPFLPSPSQRATTEQHRLRARARARTEAEAAARAASTASAEVTFWADQVRGQLHAARARPGTKSNGASHPSHRSHPCD